MEKVDREKVAEIYGNAVKIVRKGMRSGQTKTEITNALQKMLKEVVDRED